MQWEIEISAAAQSPCRAHPSWSPKPLHKTWPAGRLSLPITTLTWTGTTWRNVGGTSRLCRAGALEPAIYCPLQPAVQFADQQREGRGRQKRRRRHRDHSPVISVYLIGAGYGGIVQERYGQTGISHYRNVDVPLLSN